MLSSESSPLKKLVEAVETLEAIGENLFVAYPALSPTLQDAIDADAFRALVFRVFQIGIVNHFTDFSDSFVIDGEAADQCFKRAAVAMMRELHVHHVEGDCFGWRGRGKHELRLRVNEFADQPCRPNAVDLRPWPCRPRLAPVVLGIETGQFLQWTSFGAAQKHLHLLPARTLKKIDVANFTKLPGQPLQLGDINFGCILLPTGQKIP